MPDRDLDRIKQLDEREKADFLRRNSLTYLECCTSLMLSHLSKREVVEALRMQARIVAEFD